MELVLFTLNPFESDLGRFKIIQTVNDGSRFDYNVGSNKPIDIEIEPKTCSAEKKDELTEYWQPRMGDRWLNVLD